MTTSPVTMSEAIRNAILYQLNNIHTALPGQIISYDYTTQKASIQPTLNKVWTNVSPTTMPVLVNVPIIFQESGGASLTMPINVGDSCLILFMERSIDEWLTHGGIVSPSDPRKFDLSDAVAIMGLQPFNASFPPRSNNTDMILNYAGSSITITSTGAIKINSSSTLALGNSSIGVELIAKLITVMTALSLDSNVQSATRAAALSFVTTVTPLDGTLP
jgi:hypothetical protein